MKNSIVSIEGGKEQRVKFISPFAPPPKMIDDKRMSYGSGMVIHPSGLILTCYHVVEDMGDIRIKLANGKSVLSGKIVWKQPEKDIALIEVKANKKLKHVDFASSKNVRIGESVFAIGNPFGFDYTLTTGVVSGKNRKISTDDQEYGTVLQTDTPLNPGNSGGPLFNQRGKVIGMNAVIIPSYQNMGFAIPSDEFLPAIKKFLPRSSNQ